jgi:hypothetical protein
MEVGHAARFVRGGLLPLQLYLIQRSVIIMCRSKLVYVLSCPLNLTYVYVALGNHMPWSALGLGPLIGIPRVGHI